MIKLKEIIQQNNRVPSKPEAEPIQPQLKKASINQDESLEEQGYLTDELPPLVNDPDRATLPGSRVIEMLTAMEFDLRSAWLQVKEEEATSNTVTALSTNLYASTFFLPHMCPRVKDTCNTIDEPHGEIKRTL